MAQQLPPLLLAALPMYNGEIWPRGMLSAQTGIPSSSFAVIYLQFLLFANDLGYILHLWVVLSFFIFITTFYWVSKLQQAAYRDTVTVTNLTWILLVSWSHLCINPLHSSYLNRFLSLSINYFYGKKDIQETAHTEKNDTSCFGSRSFNCLNLGPG